MCDSLGSSREIQLRDHWVMGAPRLWVNPLVSQVVPYIEKRGE